MRATAPAGRSTDRGDLVPASAGVGIEGNLAPVNQSSISRRREATTLGPRLHASVGSSLGREGLANLLLAEGDRDMELQDAPLPGGPYESHGEPDGQLEDLVASRTCEGGIGVPEGGILGLRHPQVPDAERDGVGLRDIALDLGANLGQPEAYFVGSRADNDGLVTAEQSEHAIGVLGRVAIGEALL